MPNFIPPLPSLTPLESTRATITALEAQRREAFAALDNPGLSRDEKREQADTIKGIDIMLGQARAQVARLEAEE